MRVRELKGTPVVTVEAALRAAGGAGFGRARPRKPDSATRAPFAGPLSRMSKRGSATQFQLVPAHIRSAGDELGPHDRDYIRRKLGMGLGKFADSIERVSVRTEDVNGPRGGIDRVCRIKVVLRGPPSVVYEHRDATLSAAIDSALSGVERAVRRAVQRRRMKPLRRGGFMNMQSQQPGEAATPGIEAVSSPTPFTRAMCSASQ